MPENAYAIFKIIPLDAQPHPWTGELAASRHDAPVSRFWTFWTTKACLAFGQITTRLTPSINWALPYRVPGVNCIEKNYAVKVAQAQGIPS